MPGSILIGLVTHAKSHFNQSGAAAIQLFDLQHELVKLGFQVTAVISDRNEFTEHGEKLNLCEQISAAYHQTRLESQWRRYIREFSGATPGLHVKDTFHDAGMFVKRTFQYTRNRSILHRLMNIDLSHLMLLREGREADWVLILEDDALAPSIALAAQSIAATVETLNSTDRIFVNLSESFTAGSLGVERIIECATRIEGENLTTDLLRMPQPITNTVCANLYSESFAESFQYSLEQESRLPSYPIDWRLNKLLMEESLSPITCYWLRPGIFLQGSMR
jgi:hypothetical protein